MSRTNWIILVIVFVIAIFAYDILTKKTKLEVGHSSTTSASAWMPYKAQNGCFEILFPVLPQHMSDVASLPNDSRQIKYDIYLAQQKDGTVFMVSMIRYPSAFEKAAQDGVLEGVIKEMLASNPSNVLIDSVKSTYHDFPALNFAIKNNEFSVKSKAILAGSTLYVLTLMDRNPKELEQDFDTFVDSFVPKVSDGGS